MTKIKLSKNKGEERDSTTKSTPVLVSPLDKTLTSLEASMCRAQDTLTELVARLESVSVCSSSAPLLDVPAGTVTESPLQKRIQETTCNLNYLTARIQEVLAILII